MGRKSAATGHPSWADLRVAAVISSLHSKYFTRPPGSTTCNNLPALDGAHWKAGVRRCCSAIRDFSNNNISGDGPKEKGPANLPAPHHIARLVFVSSYCRVPAAPWGVLSVRRSGASGNRFHRGCCIPQDTQIIGRTRWDGHFCDGYSHRHRQH